MIELSNTQQALETHKAEILDNIKRLFDVFIKEVIFDGERFLIVMKTTN